MRIAGIYSFNQGNTNPCGCPDGFATIEVSGGPTTQIGISALPSSRLMSFVIARVEQALHPAPFLLRQLEIGALGACCHPCGFRVGTPAWWPFGRVLNVWTKKTSSTSMFRWYYAAAPPWISSVGSRVAPYNPGTPRLNRKPCDMPC